MDRKSEAKQIAHGNLRLNMVECGSCQQVIFSLHTHDFRKCGCGNIAVDGGLSYLRRVGGEKGYTEMSVYFDENDRGRRVGNYG